MDGRGNLERTWKVREFEKNGYGRQSSENLFFQEGKGYTFSKIV